MPTDQKSLTETVRDRLTEIKDTILPRPQFVFPAFDALPKVQGQPQGCLWGFFDKNGKKDEVGTVSLLTPEIVQQAAKEIRTGQHVQLDWSLDNVEFPGFGRKKFEQRVIDILPSSGFAGFDDEIHINTQSGSQWDSLKHCGHQATHMYYNGLTHEQAKVTQTNGIHNWCEQGGIVGRGVLVDWLNWYEKHKGTPPSPVTRHAIPISEIEETLKWQGTTLQYGDIMIVRSGYVRWHNNASAEERKKGTQDNSIAIGLEASDKTIRWLYDHHLAAVAGDTVAFEAWPPQITDGFCLHEWLLVQWGTPIGELWDLEKLSEICEQAGRWTFFLTSAPLHVKGGVGSPPGAIAIL